MQEGETGWFGIKFSIINNTYEIVAPGTEFSVARDAFYNVCKRLCQDYPYRRLMRLVFEVLLEVVEKRKLKDRIDLENLLGDIKVDL